MIPGWKKDCGDPLSPFIFTLVKKSSSIVGFKSCSRWGVEGFFHESRVRV